MFKVQQKILHVLISAFGAMLLAGCVSNPSERRSEIQRAKSVTIICCDVASAPAVVSGTSMYGGALLGLGGGMLGAIATRSGLTGTQDNRTKAFLQRIDKDSLPLASEFVAEVERELKLRGYDVRVLSERGFDGYNNRYATNSGEITSQLVLEVRYAAQIVDHYERFFPTLAANYAVRRASDYATLNFGYIATRDLTIKAPSFGEANVIRAPILNVMGPIGAVFRNAQFVDLKEEQLVRGNDSVLIENARRLYDGTVSANKDLAALLVRRFDQVHE
jgi:hypothetical protein